MQAGRGEKPSSVNGLKATDPRSLLQLGNSPWNPECGHSKKWRCGMKIVPYSTLKGKFARCTRFCSLNCTHLNILHFHKHTINLHFRWCWPSASEHWMMCYSFLNFALEVIFSKCILQPDQISVIVSTTNTVSQETPGHWKHTWAQENGLIDFRLMNKFLNLSAAVHFSPILNDLQLSFFHLSSKSSWVPILQNFAGKS